MHALFAGLHVARQEFGLLIDLFDLAFKDFVGEGIDANVSFLADLYVSNLRFWYVNTDIDLVRFQQGSDRRVGRDQIAGADVEDFHGGGGWRNNLALAETRFVIRERGFRGIYILAPIATLELVERGKRLLITSLGSGDFFRAIPLLQFIEFVLGILGGGHGNAPGCFGGIALLFGD